MSAVGGTGHAGIILVSGERFPRAAGRSAELVRALAALLRVHPADEALRDALVWL